MKIAWSVKLPMGAKLKIKNGESVECDEIIYEHHLSIIERLPLIGWQNIGANQRKTILQNILKKELNEGEILWKGPWYSHIVIKSPGVGKCLGVDEFGNIELETETEEKYLAPISTKKIRIESDKIIFELKGDEFEVEGVNELKVWGSFYPKIIDKVEQISFEQNGKIVVINNSLEAAIKAEAIGVSGLILIEVEKLKEFEDCEVPVVVMEKEDAKKLIKIASEDNYKVWLNASSSKVLLVLE
jgi:hypothetical protein